MSSFRLQGVKLGLKYVMFLCRMCLSMYFSPKKILCLIYIIFSVLTFEFNMSLVRHGGTKTPMAMTQRHSAFPLERSYLLNLKNVSGISLLILLH